MERRPAGEEFRRQGAVIGRWRRPMGWSQLTGPDTEHRWMVAGVRNRGVGRIVVGSDVKAEALESEHHAIGLAMLPGTRLGRHETVARGDHWLPFPSEDSDPRARDNVAAFTERSPMSEGHGVLVARLCAQEGDRRLQAPARNEFALTSSEAKDLPPRHWDDHRDHGILEMLEVSIASLTEDSRAVARERNGSSSRLGPNLD